MYLHSVSEGRQLTDILRPRVLRFRLQCSEHALINMLRHHVNLEELELYLPRPSSLGRSFVDSLIATAVALNGTIDKGYNSCEGRENKWKVSLCPSLKVLRLRYQRWLRRSECDEIAPTLLAVVWSREQSIQRLQTLLVCWKGGAAAAGLTR